MQSASCRTRSINHTKTVGNSIRISAFILTMQQSSGRQYQEPGRKQRCQPHRVCTAVSDSWPITPTTKRSRLGLLGSV
jgi:hypothetical protein